MEKQAVYDVIHSNYRCTPEDAVALAGIQMQVDFGDHKDAVHTTGFLAFVALLCSYLVSTPAVLCFEEDVVVACRSKIHQYIPSNLLRLNSPDQWEKMIFREHAQLLGHPKHEAQVACVNVCVCAFMFMSSAFLVTMRLYVLVAGSLP